MITAPGESLTIPDAQNANYYFLGWAESSSSDKTETLYVPETYSDIRKTLNTPDRIRLGYEVKSEHELKNITSDKTLHAVYYKKFDATTALADDFI